MNDPKKQQLAPQKSNISDQNGKEEPDLSVAEFMQKIRTIDVNSYATRKSLAVGLLDLALLTANAAQLKNILTYGPTHQFYILMYTLIIISIALQLFQACLILVLVIVYDLNKLEEQRRADIINSTLVGITLFTVVVNVIINVFDMRTTPDTRSHF